MPEHAPLWLLKTLIWRWIECSDWCLHESGLDGAFHLTNLDLAVYTVHHFKYSQIF